MLGALMLARVQALGQTTAYLCGGERWTGEGLAGAAMRFAAWLQAQGAAGPVLLFGHKQRFLPACMLGCMLAGVPYVPVDCSTPPARAAEIAKLSGAALAVCAQDTVPGVRCVPARMLDGLPGDAQWRPAPVEPAKTCYILFTSGTSGSPKGVCISYANLAHFLGWLEGLPAIRDSGEGPILNHARFSFDLSVADLHYALYTGRCLFALEQPAQRNFAALFRQLAQSGATLAVMTPSFAQYCLLDRAFCRALLPGLRTVFFCGEALAAQAAARCGCWTSICARWARASPAKS